MAELRTYLMRETKKRRYKESKSIKKVKAELSILKKLEGRHGVSNARTNALKRLKCELYDLEHPEVKEILPTKQAKRAYDLSDRGTKDFFRNYKAASKQQWINKVKIADEWKEDREPIFSDAYLDMRYTRTPKNVTEEFQRYFQYLFAAKWCYRPSEMLK